MTLDHLSAEEITSFVDGESHDQRIADHLASCGECRMIADDERQIKALLGSMPEPQLPRSFVLTPQMVPVATPLSSPGITTTAAPRTAAGISKYEPVLRFLSIAAVLALLVLGGAQITGIGVDDPNSDPQVTQTETETSDNALEEQDSTIARGEVRAQGESAAAGAGPINAQHVLGDTPARATDDGLTTIEITTIGVGVVALASIAGWILIRYRAGASSPQIQEHIHDATI